MKVIKGNKIVEVTEKAYKVIYKGAGYKPYVENIKSTNDEVDENGISYEDFTKAELKEVLDGKGIDYSDRDNKNKLISLVLGDD